MSDIEDALLVEVIDGRTHAVFHDSNPMNPREGYDLGIIFSRHGRYDFNDKGHSLDDSSCTSWGDVEKLIKNNGGKYLLPLFLYDHSGLALATTSFNDRWDSGQVGYIYTTKENISEIFGGKPTKKNIESLLNSEVEVYNKYLNGEVFGYRVFEGVVCKACGHDDLDEVDSCWGFYSIEDAMESSKY